MTSSIGYTATALGDFGLWPVSTTDVNNQSTTYGYNALGSMTSLMLPAETSGSITKGGTTTTLASGISYAIPPERRCTSRACVWVMASTATLPATTSISA